MAIDKSLYRAPQGLEQLAEGEPDIEVEIENPEAVRINADGEEIFSMEQDGEDENFDEKIKSRFRDEFSYGSFSEGEKMRIDLALLFTWRAVAKLRNSASTNLLIMDEVFDSSLDATGMEEFFKIIKSVGADTNVFIISHKGDQLFDKFSNIIKFEKNKNFSMRVS